MNEEWRDIEGYEGLYQVSNLGRVKSKRGILKPRITPKGYLRIQLSKNSNRKDKFVHVLVAETFLCKYDSALQVNHIDGDKTNNTVDNLEWVTVKENQQHAYNAGLHKPIKHTEETKKKISKTLKGENHPQAKRVICITTGETFNCILEAEKKYNVANQSISKCCRGKRKSAGKHPVTGEKLVWEYIKGE